MPALSRLTSLLVAVGLFAWPTLVRPQTPATTITSTPAAVAFQYQLGPAAKLPAPQSLNLKSNVAKLAAALNVTGDPPSNGDWLELSVRRGTTITLPATLSLTVTPTSLPAGTYSATVNLSAVDSTAAPVNQTVAVTLTVVPPPSQLDFSPASGLTFNYTTGGSLPPDQQFLMYSEGAPLSVTVSISGAPWLKVTPTGSVQVGGLFKLIQVSIDPLELFKLVPKVYSARIAVSAPTAINKSATYPITLNVNAAVPSVTDTWPTGMVLNTAGTGVTTVVLDGAGFFDTSTVTAAGFTSSAAITVTDSTTGTALTASETISVPVYPSGAAFLRLKLGSPLPTGFVGVAYSKDLNAFVDGGTGPYTWSAPDLVTAGLSFSGGVLSGTPTAAGNYGGVITVTDANSRTAYMPVNLTVHPSAPPPTGAVWITLDNPVPSAEVGTAYSANVNVLGGTGPYTWTLNPSTPIAAGLGIGATGATTAISGTPASVGPTGNLAAKRINDGALQVTVPNTYLASQGFLRMTVHTPVPGGGDSNEAHFEVYGPEPRILAVVNAASYVSGAVAPGELISIFGTGLGPAVLSVYDPNASPLSTALPAPAPIEGVTGVQFSDGTTTWNAPLIYTSATQVGAMVPFEVGGAAALTMTGTYGPAGAALISKAFPLTVAAAAPGLFTADASGRGQAAALNYIAATNDYTVNSPTTPALLKDTPIVVLYMTGFGTTKPDSVSNMPAAPGVDTKSPVTVTIDGKTASPVQTAVPPNSFPGLLQLNVTVPSDAVAGKMVPVKVTVSGADTQSGVTIALK